MHRRKCLKNFLGTNHSSRPTIPRDQPLFTNHQRCPSPTWPVFPLWQKRHCSRRVASLKRFARPRWTCSTREKWPGCSQRPQRLSRPCNPLQTLQKNTTSRPRRARVLTFVFAARHAGKSVNTCVNCSHSHKESFEGVICFLWCVTVVGHAV